MSHPSLPLVDLADFDASETRSERFVAHLGEALAEFGFVAVTGHGVPAELIAQAYAAAWQVFALPGSVKQRYEIAGLHGQRGFVGPGRERAKGATLPDRKEFWHVGRAGDLPANIWPTEVPEFQPALTALYGALEDCGLRLLEAVALYLGELRSALRQLAVGGSSLLRVAHYPATQESEDSPPGASWAAPHEDINLLTLLCEATGSGLELLRPDGSWMAVEAPPGQIIVDAADMLRNLTNGLLRRVTHRVVASPGSQDRLSLPFFLHPRPEVDLTPLPGCVARTGGQALFRTQTAGEYLNRRLRQIGLAEADNEID
jgi:isopenicillin N synthase-like dioxygenase